MKSFLLLVVMALTIGAAFAAKPPKAVLAAFHKAYPEATKVKWDTEDKAYEAHFWANNHGLSATYAKDGTLIESEESIKKGDLPMPVSKAINQAHPKAKIDEYAKITKASGIVVYEVEIGGKDLLFMPDGSVAAK